METNVYCAECFAIFWLQLFQLTLDNVKHSASLDRSTYPSKPEEIYVMYIIPRI